MTDNTMATIINNDQVFDIKFSHEAGLDDLMEHLEAGDFCCTGTQRHTTAEVDSAFRMRVYSLLGVVLKDYVATLKYDLQTRYGGSPDFGAEDEEFLTRELEKCLEFARSNGYDVDTWFDLRRNDEQQAPYLDPKVAKMMGLQPKPTPGLTHGPEDPGRDYELHKAEAESDQ